MKINSNTKLICLLGHPVKHSKSPDMHNMNLESINENAVYMAFDVENENLGKTIDGLKSINFIGANVTVPHKENVIKFLDRLTEEAKLIGAVNTIYYENDKLVGDNTDGKGFMISLKEETKFESKDKKILILGAGGAAKAVSVKLVMENVKEIYLYELDNEKGNNLKNHLEKISATKVFLVNKEELQEYAKKSDLIVNCTPVGMKDSDPLLLSLESFKKEQVVFDLIYNPEKTKLLKEAEKKGAKILNGAGMLVYQGALAFEKWTGQKANIEKMFYILLNRGL